MFIIEFVVHVLLLCSFYSTTHFVFLLGKLCNILPRQLNYKCIKTPNRCYRGGMETSLVQFVHLNAAACAQLFLGSTTYGYVLPGMLTIAYEAISC